MVSISLSLQTTLQSSHHSNSLTHDPARKAQKKKEQEESLEKFAIEFFTPGVPVVCRWGNYTYEGVISEQRLEEKRWVSWFFQTWECDLNIFDSCIVDFTDGSGQYTAPWTSLKLLKQEPEDEIIAPE